MSTNWVKPLLRDRENIFSWCLDFIRALFPVLLFTYLLLILTDTLFEDSVSLYINLNYLVMLVIIVGIAAVFVVPIMPVDIPGRLNIRHILAIACVVIGAVTITWHKLGFLGWISYIISVLSGGLILFLALHTRGGDEGEKSEDEDSQNN